MPKEIAHFVMARMAARAMTRDQDPFARAVAKFPLVFTFGAVVPDINFYCLAGRHAPSIRALSDPFHRAGPQALMPVLAFLDQARSRTGPDLPALALGAGVICHILADTVFHPLVYYFAGMDQVHPGATARHRQFETAMDLYFWHQEPCEPLLGRLISSLEIPGPEQVALLSALFQPGPLGQGAVRRAMAWHSRIQYLFHAPWMKTWLARLSAMGKPLPAKATGLVYPFRRPRPLPFFSNPLAFQDPCTCEPKAARIMDMAGEAVDGTLKVLALAAGHMARHHPLAPALVHCPDLPVIRPGLPREGFSLWQEKADIMPWLYQGYPPPF